MHVEHLSAIIVAHMMVMVATTLPMIATAVLFTLVLFTLFMMLMPFVHRHWASDASLTHAQSIVIVGLMLITSLLFVFHEVLLLIENGLHPAPDRGARPRRRFLLRQPERLSPSIDDRPLQRSILELRVRGFGGGS